MKITIVGTGYVGLVTGTCFAAMGTNVTCVDIDEDKINNLKNGIMPIFEPGLEELVHKNVKDKRLSFSTSLKESLKDTPVIFSAVGTPPDDDGSADLKYVLDVAKTVGKYVTEYFVLVTKSTVPVGTAIKVKEVIKEELDKRGLNSMNFDVVSNPEFLKEGAAIKDFLNPDRVVIGVDSNEARKMMEKLYKPFTLNDFPIIFMDVASAEMTKYAANGMLATRISFMNEIANLCEIVGADVDMVRKGIGSDTRIGSKFLYAGTGYGGSCFPKDVKALAQTGKENGYKMTLIEAVEEVNENQKQIVFEKLKKEFKGDVKGKIIGLWGLAFKPGTDDMREAPSLIVIQQLLDAGATIKVFDPIAIEETKRRIGEEVVYCENIYEAALNADAVVLMTEWKEFRLPSWDVIKKTMKGNIIVDGRNIYNSEEIQSHGFKYLCIGKK
ncbi:UDP-glucose 6-dehydrogenase [Tenacibaculum sp. Bg11-29]|uniref:UDP-glucose dehydrogenase family protein n=1 Tax=Tenacibaculum TaxID=104267 RepID=UPI000C32A9BB|nr:MULTISPECIES: UDP-glucose/GDP-mannose dehydrogenase family protein [Tenacibaculum]PKH50428.1 UDP-glucose 6-dehydrogenase [Tenacibaculum sp. Bg11-29]